MDRIPKFMARIRVIAGRQPTLKFIRAETNQNRSKDTSLKETSNVGIRIARVDLLMI